MSIPLQAIVLLAMALWASLLPSAEGGYGL